MNDSVPPGWPLARVLLLLLPGRFPRALVGQVPHEYKVTGQAEAEAAPRRIKLPLSRDLVGLSDLINKIIKLN